MAVWAGSLEHQPEMCPLVRTTGSLCSGVPGHIWADTSECQLHCWVQTGPVFWQPGDRGWGSLLVCRPKRWFWGRTTLCTVGTWVCLRRWGELASKRLTNGAGNPPRRELMWVKTSYQVSWAGCRNVEHGLKDHSGSHDLNISPLSNQKGAK